MLINIVFILVANLLFLYFFWLRLKEDYASERIFSIAFYIIATIVFTNLISRKFFPDTWFWLGFLGLGIGLSIGVLRYHLRVIETIEAGVVAILPGLGMVFLSDFLESRSIYSGIGAVVIFGLSVLFIILDKHYKNFSWYKSGRIGFSGLSILGLFFLIRSVVAMRFPNVVSFSGEGEVVVSAGCAFAAFLILFNLARK